MRYGRSGFAKGATYASFSASTKVSWKSAGTRTYSGHKQICGRKLGNAVHESKCDAHLTTVRESAPEQPPCGHLEVYLGIKHYGVLS